MSDLDESSMTQQPFEENPQAYPADAHSSAGAMLRHAREAAGLHIAALAVSLKVPVKKLEALEADQFDLLPDAVFVRALASSVCRHLKMDPQPVLALLPQTIHPNLAGRDASINAPFRAAHDSSARSSWAQVSRTAVWGGLLLLLATLVLVFLPTVKSAVEQIAGNLAAMSASNEPAKPAVTDSVDQTGPSAGAVPASPAAPPAAGSSVIAALPGGTTASSSISGSATTTLQAARPAAEMPPSALPGTVTVLMASASAASAPVAGSVSDIVVFSAKSESWVEVTDARGQVVLRRTLATGEVAGASGTLPMAAVVGRADATQVQVRGKALDLLAIAKNNVARFEVK